jgi:hypothetical protein
VADGIRMICPACKRASLDVQLRMDRQKASFPIRLGGS